MDDIKSGKDEVSYVLVFKFSRFGRNAAQGIREMVETATDKVYRENHKEKHSEDAHNGWFYYVTRFAIPLYDNEKKTGEYNAYSACLVVNHAANGKIYLYDVVDIKKEASNPLKTNK